MIRSPSILKRRLGVLAAAALAAGPLPATAAPCGAGAKPANLDFVLKDLEGNDVTLSAYKGHVIVLDFWATWCAPCKIEIPNFVELYERYRAQGLVVLGVSVDDPVATLKPFAERYKMSYPVLVGADREDLKNAFGPPVGYPTSFVIDRDGKICVSHTGFATKETFERDIVSLL